MIGIGILTAVVFVMYFLLVKSAAMADRWLEKMQRPATGREVDGWNGN